MKIFSFFKKSNEKLDISEITTITKKFLEQEFKNYKIVGIVDIKVVLKEEYVEITYFLVSPGLFIGKNGDKVSRLAKLISKSLDIKIKIVTNNVDFFKNNLTNN